MGEEVHLDYNARGGRSVKPTVEKRGNSWKPVLGLKTTELEREFVSGRRYRVTLTV